MGYKNSTGSNDWSDSQSGKSNLISCSDCGCEMSVNAKRCPKCGAPNYIRNKMIAENLSKNLWKVALIIILFVVFIWFVVNVM